MKTMPTKVYFLISDKGEVSSTHLSVRELSVFLKGYNSKYSQKQIKQDLKVGKGRTVYHIENSSYILKEESLNETINYRN